MSSEPKKYRLSPVTAPPRTDLKIPYQKELNAQQYGAVTAPGGPSLIIAGAGTGKTRVLTYRVAWLIENGLAPEAILLLTFTRKSAQEMMRRAGDLLDERCSRVQGGTFHGFANMVLRRFGQAIGIPPSFTILDRSDSEDAIHLVRNRLGMGEGDKRFPKKGTLASVFSRSVNTGLSYRKILADDYPQFADLGDELEKIAAALAEYKTARGLLDYDDLLVRLRDLLTHDEGLSGRVASSWSHVLVDELQDTNLLQMDILKALVKPHGNITAVGDDFQSIYAFRGAEVRNMLDFAQVFPGARVLKIEENYRSTRPILDFTNQIIDCAPEKYEKNLFSSLAGEEKPVLLELPSELHQSTFVCQRVLELREEGLPLSDMAVLFRTGYHSNDLELALTRARIPFKKFGGFRFFDLAHVKDLLAHLRIVANPFDALSWNRVLLLQEGIGPAAATKLVEQIVEDKRGFEALTGPAYRGKKYADALVRLAKYHEKCVTKKLTSSEALEEALKTAEPALKIVYDDWRKRRDDVESLGIAAERTPDLTAFLADMTLEPPDDTRTELDAVDRDEGTLTLSTIHSAKGLEWSAVFLLSLVEGYLPSQQSLSQDKQIEEERRLFYVAATRAKRKLYLLAPRLPPPARFWSSPDFTQATGPSRFLKEIPELQDMTEVWEIDDGP